MDAREKVDQIDQSETPPVGVEEEVGLSTNQPSPSAPAGWGHGPSSGCKLPGVGFGVDRGQ